MIAEGVYFLCSDHSKGAAYRCMHDYNALCPECLHLHMSKGHKVELIKGESQKLLYDNIAKLALQAKKILPFIEASKAFPDADVAELLLQAAEANKKQLYPPVSKVFESCKLISEEEAQWLASQFTTPLHYAKLVFQAKKDGFRLFHTYCDNIGPTVTICKATSGKIFGGYSSISWNSVLAGYTGYLGVSNFLFSITKKTRHGAYLSFANAVYLHHGYGPTFGGGHDLYICIEPNNNSYSNFGSTYASPFPYESKEAKEYLAGTYNFTAEDYAVFQVV